LIFGQPIENDLRVTYGEPAKVSANNTIVKKDIEIVTFENGDTYEGSLDRNGGFRRGKYTWKSGEFYEGSWFQGKRMGSGKFTFSTGNSCQGEYMFNKLSGYGIWGSNLESEPEFCYEVENEFRITTLLKAYTNLASGDKRWKTSTLFDAIIHPNEERKEYTVLENYILSEGLIAKKLAEEQQAENDRIAELRRQKAYSEKLEKERIAEAKRKEKRAKKLAKARRREYVKQRNREDERAYSEYMYQQERIERNISRREEIRREERDWQNAIDRQRYSEESRRLTQEYKNWSYIFESYKLTQTPNEVKNVETDKYRPAIGQFKQSEKKPFVSNCRVGGRVVANPKQCDK